MTAERHPYLYPDRSPTVPTTDQPTACPVCGHPADSHTPPGYGTCRRWGCECVGTTGQTTPAVDGPYDAGDAAPAAALPPAVLTDAHDAAAQQVSEMNGWDYDDQARAAVDAALPHIAAHYQAQLEQTLNRYADVFTAVQVWRHGGGEPGYDAAGALIHAVDDLDDSDWQRARVELDRLTALLDQAETVRLDTDDDIWRQHPDGRWCRPGFRPLTPAELLRRYGTTRPVRLVPHPYDEPTAPTAGTQWAVHWPGREAPAPTSPAGQETQQ